MKKIRVPTGCILSVETVPTGCILSVGTVPMGCILIQIQRFMLYQDSIHPPSFSVFYLPITLRNKIKKRKDVRNISPDSALLGVTDA